MPFTGSVHATHQSISTFVRKLIVQASDDHPHDGLYHLSAVASPTTYIVVLDVYRKKEMTFRMDGDATVRDLKRCLFDSQVSTTSFYLLNNGKKMEEHLTLHSFGVDQLNITVSWLGIGGMEKDCSSSGGELQNISGLGTISLSTHPTTHLTTQPPTQLSAHQPTNPHAYP